MFGCPIQGEVAFESVAALARWYADLGVEAVLFGDTTGMANPVQVESFFQRMRELIPDVAPVAHSMTPVARRLPTTSPHSGRA